MPSPLRCVALLVLVVVLTGRLPAGPAVVTIATNAAPDALAAQARLRVAPGLKVELWAGEPLVQNVTSFCFDALGRAYVVETGRRRTSVFDIRGLQPWLDDDYSFRTVNDRANCLRRRLTPGDPDYAKFKAAVAKRGGFEDFNHDGVIDARDLEVESERIRLVWDADGDGHADHATTFADGFNSPVSGVAAGVLAQGTNVWFTCIPDLWKFSVKPISVFSGRPGTPPPTATENLKLKTEKLLSGFGVHIAFGGHDLHGLIKGPDGRLYFTIADRGTCVTNREGRVISLPDCGAVFRCEPDGKDFELFAKGLRNPQELCFDDFGNLWTADNNADGGDKARWTLVLEGADYGWTIGWQWLPKLGAWNSERLWHTRESNTAAYIVPPVAHIGHGPAGIAYYPGTGLPARYDRHFFLSDFPGGVRTFTVEPDGAFFKVGPASSPSAMGLQPANPPGAGSPGETGKMPVPLAWLEDNSATNLTGKVLWDLSPVDVAFPPGGGVTVADWVQGWDKTGKGRLWHVFDPALANDPLIAETKRQLAEGMTQRKEKELLALLGHRDQRVRLEAQWELAGRGPEYWAGLRRTAGNGSNVRARFHALWGLDQLVRQNPNRDFIPELLDLCGLLNDHEPLVRAQTARLLGRAHLVMVQSSLRRLFADPDPRVATAAVVAYRDLFSAFNRSPQGGLRFRENRWERLVRELQQMVHLRTPLLQQPGGVNWPILELAPLLSSSAGVEPVVQLAAARLLAEIGESMGTANQGAFRQYLMVLAKSSNANTRLSLLLAERRLASDQVSTFLVDAAPLLVLEAARAIHDVPIPEAMPALAALLDSSSSRGDEAHSSNSSLETRPSKLGQSLLTSAATNWPAALNFTRDEWRTWVLRRAVNANFRLGTATNAVALVIFAANTNAPESVRVEALDELADWAKPPGRDQIVGLWRPLPPRDPAPARAALDARWNALTVDASTNVVLATLRAGAALGLVGLADRLTALHPHPSAVVRAEVARLAAAGNSVSVADLVATLAKGSPPEQQAAFVALGSSSDPAAAATLADWMKRLLVGQVAPELQLDVLEAAKVAQASRLASPSHNAGETTALRSWLAAWTNGLPKDDALAAFRPALLGGEGARGRRLFIERQDFACFRCHKLRGEGGEVGPELAGLGRAKGREYVLQSILQPNAQIATGFENILLTLEDGSTVTGVVKSDTVELLTLMTAEGSVVKVKQAEIATRERGLSAMPEGYGDIIAPRDLRDLIQALSE